MKTLSQMNKKELIAEVQSLRSENMKRDQSSASMFVKLDNLQRENADLKIMIYRLQQEKAQAIGQLAEYHATLMTQKALIETLEKRLNLYKKNEN